jgi:hypothetical protein
MNGMPFKECAICTRKGKHGYTKENVIIPDLCIACATYMSNGPEPMFFQPKTLRDYVEDSMKENVDGNV